MVPKSGNFLRHEIGCFSTGYGASGSAGGGQKLRAQADQRFSHCLLKMRIADKFFFAMFSSIARELRVYDMFSKMLIHLQSLTFD